MPRQEAAPEATVPLTPDEEAVVRSLSRVIYALPRALDTDMVREQRLPLIEYLALMYLSEVPERQMRMSDLARACELSVSGMTRVVHRLENEGLVQRVKCTQDARGWNAVLTDSRPRPAAGGVADQPVLGAPPLPRPSRGPGPQGARGGTEERRHLTAPGRPGWPRRRDAAATSPWQRRAPATAPGQAFAVTGSPASDAAAPAPSPTASADGVTGV